MSRIEEYLKLVPRGIRNIDKVIEGVINSVKLEFNLLPDDEQEEITRRRVICAGCEFMSKNARNYISDRTDEHCIFCGCPISTRTSSLESNCGIEEYNKKSGKPIPLKWEKYEKG